MSQPTTRFWEIFFQVYDELPRQGPGNLACAQRALSLCRDLPTLPAVLDLGCGVGGQTIHLTHLLPNAHITAMDNHPPFIQRLETKVAQQGLLGRVRPIAGDMSQPGLPPESFHLIWSEGALYNLGIERALGICRGLLRAGGCLAFSESVWRRDNPPPQVKASFDLDYPSMGRVPDVIGAIHNTGFSLLGHFTLPHQAWWDDFYTPMERQIEVLRSKYANDAQALEILDQLAQEPQMHSHHSDYYAYEFFVVQKPDFHC